MSRLLLSNIDQVDRISCRSIIELIYCRVDRSITQRHLFLLKHQGPKKKERVSWCKAVLCCCCVFSGVRFWSSICLPAKAVLCCFVLDWFGSFLSSLTGEVDEGESIVGFLLVLKSMAAVETGRTFCSSYVRSGERWGRLTPFFTANNDPTLWLNVVGQKCGCSSEKELNNRSCYISPKKYIALYSRVSCTIPGSKFTSAKVIPLFSKSPPQCFVPKIHIPKNKSRFISE